MLIKPCQQNPVNSQESGMRQGIIFGTHDRLSNRIVDDTLPLHLHAGEQ